MISHKMWDPPTKIELSLKHNTNYTIYTLHMYTVCCEMIFKCIYISWLQLASRVLDWSPTFSTGLFSKPVCSDGIQQKQILNYNPQYATYNSVAIGLSIRAYSIGRFGILKKLKKSKKSIFRPDFLPFCRS